MGSNHTCAEVLCENIAISVPVIGSAKSANSSWSSKTQSTNLLSRNTNCIQQTSIRISRNECVAILRAFLRRLLEEGIAHSRFCNSDRAPCLHFKSISKIVMRRIRLVSSLFYSSEMSRVKNTGPKWYDLRVWAIWWQAMNSMLSK
jgi:hypothetical protein